ncbi:hypothetical protein P4278_31130 [Bacillus thuringiensis]|nr:hypothetical protein [Bacillus thuringiensis]MED2758737.1 hypothetical protein [Bacillus thuringiensis]MED2775548.1 hypothetical protein [Bacillus thuringiensis]MED2784062.1 hypothetical protein [Bacillus thuringiensis]
MEELEQVLNNVEKVQLFSETRVEKQQIPECTTPCQNILNTTGTIKLTAGTSNPSSVVFPEPLNVGDTFPIFTDPTYLRFVVSQCEATASISTPCGVIECDVPVYQVNACGNLPFYFKFPAQFWPCTGPKESFDAYLNDVIRVNNVLCYNCDGSAPTLCENGISQVNGVATLIKICRDDVYIYFDFSIEIVLPGC